MFFQLSTLIVFACISASFGQVKLVDSGEAIKRGIAFYDSGKYKLAIEQYLTVHPSDTNYVYMQSELALACIANKSYDSAIQISENALTKTSIYRAHLLKSLAIALDRGGKYEKSLETFKKAIEQYPFNTSLQFNLGITYFNHNKYEEAEKCFMRVLELNPFHPGSHNNLAKISALKGRKTQALLSLGVYLGVQEKDNTALVYLERLCKNEITDEGTFVDASPNPFEKLDRIIKARVALEKGFDNKISVDAALVKQMQLMIGQLPSVSDRENFWVRFYLPFYNELKTKNLVEPFLYHLLTSSSIESVPKWKSRNKKQLDAFYTSANASLNEHRKRVAAPAQFGYTSPYVRAWLADNKALEALGETNSDEKKIGKWFFFDEVSSEKTAEGEFDKTGEKIGVWKYYHRNGVIKSISNYSTGLVEFFREDGGLSSRYYEKKDKIEGEVELFYACGALKEKLMYKDGNRDGVGATYFVNGTKSSTYFYKDDQMSGEYISYYSNGRVKAKESYVNDKISGDFVSYYADGRVERKGKYEAGDAAGEWNYYHDNGKLEKKGSFIKGVARGEWNFYDREGILDETRFLNEKGDIQGENKIYYRSKLHYIILYQNMIPTEYRFFDSQGKMISKSGDKNGNFSVKGYFPSGELNYEGQYKKGKRSGEWKTFFRNGAIKNICQYAEGSLEGESIDYFKSGGKKEIYTYKNDELNGYFQEFYVHGKKKAEGNFLNGNREQMWVWYYPDGTKETEQYYLRGELRGTSTEYKEDGKIVSVFEYKNAVTDQLTFYNSKGEVTLSKKLRGTKEEFKIAYKNQQPQIVMEFTCGEYSNDLMRYQPNGKLLSKIPNSNGIRDGEYVAYTLNGNLEAKGNYLNGNQHGVWTWYNEAGKVNSVGYYVHNKRDSLWSYYNDDGSLSISITYRNDVREGLTKVYNPEGILVVEKMFSQGDMVSFRALVKDGTMSEWTPFTTNQTIRAYFTSGKLAYEEPHKDGLLDGVLKEYYQSGQLYNETNFQLGDYSGKFVAYHSNGKISNTVNYVYDNAQGVWQYFDANGNLIKSENYLLGNRHGKYTEFKNGKKTLDLVYWCGTIED